jgi:hypothetical protein
MKHYNKSPMIAVILLLAISSLTLLSVMPALAQTATPTPDFPFYISYNPSLVIPEFTIQLSDHSYDVPSTTTSTTDPYTGNITVTTQPSYHVENKTIDFTIPNQPHASGFVPHFYGVNLYYDIRTKGHFANDWEELYVFDVDRNSLPVAPNASFTYVSIPRSNSSYGEVDFQIRAINGTIKATFPGIDSPFGYWRYEASGWSSIHTVNMSDGAIVITPYVNPTFAPTVTPSPTAQPGTISPSTIQPTATATTESSAQPTENKPALDVTGILFAAVIALVIAVAVLAAALLRRTRSSSAMSTPKAQET